MLKVKETKKLLSIISPCFNEEDNVAELYRRLELVTTATSDKYEFEFIFIDNASEDRTQELLRALADKDKRVKLIFNNRNFGHARSPYWAMLQARGEAVICIVSDLQDPPELIRDFISEWEKGYKVVLAVKPVSYTSFLMHFLRTKYYDFLDKISDVKHIKNATGFGLYDRAVIDEIKKIGDPCPYLRGLVVELGYEIKTINFGQRRRLHGVSKNNFYTLYDYAMLGIISHSKIPIRIASFLGFIIGIISLLMGCFYFVMKLFYWDNFALGLSPVVVGMFFLFGLLFIILGVLGEYVAWIHARLQNRPTIVERERVNF